MLAMTDWKQIQARIRKARTGTDAIPKMTELFERTRDAMVAFELARLHEKAGANEEAVKWYSTAHQRFRRAQWKKKAEEALARLGAAPPAPSEQLAVEPMAPAYAEEPAAPAPPERESQLDFAEVILGEGPVTAAPAEPAREPRAAPAAEERKRTRRGRRGGRGRRKHGKVHAAPPLPAPARAERPAPPRVEARPAPPREQERTPAAPRAVEPGPISISAAMAARARAGDPALVSRSAQLEAQLRRLLAAAPISPEEFDSAPAGPGVLLLSDSELTSHYYVEACQTLRVALRLIAQGKGGRGREGSVRASLAEHLDISDSKVAKYLKEHCAVRWIQLDEGATHLAHFAIALLRPALNE